MTYMSSNALKIKILFGALKILLGLVGIRSI